MLEELSEEEKIELLFRLAKILGIFTAIAIMVFYLSSCANQQEIQTLADAEVRAVQAQMVNQQPLIRIECGNEQDACKGMKFAYSPKPKVIRMRVRGTNDVLVETIPSVIGGAATITGWVAGASVLKDAFQSSGGGNVTNNNMGNGAITNSATKTSANNNSSDGNTTSGDVSSSDNNNSSTNNPTTMTTTSTENNPVSTGTTTTGNVAQ